VGVALTAVGIDFPMPATESAFGCPPDIKRAAWILGRKTVESKPIVTIMASIAIPTKRASFMTVFLLS